MTEQWGDVNVAAAAALVSMSQHNNWELRPKLPDDISSTQQEGGLQYSWYPYHDDDTMHDEERLSPDLPGTDDECNTEGVAEGEMKSWSTYRSEYSLLFLQMIELKAQTRPLNLCPSPAQCPSHSQSHSKSQ